MKNKEIRISELQKAKDEGFIEEFILRNGRVYELLYPEQVYAACQVITGSYVCPEDNQVVYIIETPEGKKGTARKPNE